MCLNGRSFKADYAAITVSLGVLKSKIIEFAPKLPEPKIEAIEKIGFTNYHKIHLEFEEVFWEKEADFIVCESGGFYKNVAKYLKKPVLFFFQGH